VTLLQLGPGDLTANVPQLMQGAAVVALVPATELKGWGAEMAWAIARAAAAAGRRTALVDCFVDAPTLHAGAGAGSDNDEGLVDVFEYGASLNRIVQQQPQANLFFIPAGTFAPDAQPLMENPRWRRLSAGFRHEEALLLLYVAAEHLGNLAAAPDGMIVLAPQGLGTAATEAPAVMEAIGRGMPLLAVVAEITGVVKSSYDPGEDSGTEVEAWAEAEVEPTPSPPRESVARSFTMTPAAGRRVPGWLWAAVLLGCAAGGAWYWRDRIPYQRWLAALAAARGTATRDSATAPAPAAGAATRLSEPLPWAVSVAALSSVEAAIALGESLEARAVPAMIAPLRLPNRALIHRVYAGPWRDSASADSVLGALRAAGVLGDRQGGVRAVPLSLALAGGLGEAAARRELVRLRRVGVPAFMLGEPGGTFRLWAGAYDAAVQAALLTDLLTPTGAGALEPRVGAMR
jgi:hypothetical protein